MNEKGWWGVEKNDGHRSCNLRRSTGRDLGSISSLLGWTLDQEILSSVLKDNPLHFLQILG